LGLAWLVPIWGSGIRFTYACAIPLVLIWLMRSIDRDVQREPSDHLNKTLAKAGMLLVMYALMVCVGFFFGYPA
jgi:Trk-type K+ transport system membrane component